MPPGPTLTLVIVEGKWMGSSLLLRCRHTPPSTIRFSLPPPPFWKFHISRTPPSRIRTFVVAVLLLLTARTRRYDPAPVTTTSFVVSALPLLDEMVRFAPRDERSPPSRTSTVELPPLWYEIESPLHHILDPGPATSSNGAFHWSVLSLHITPR